MQVIIPRNTYICAVESGKWTLLGVSIIVEIYPIEDGVAGFYLFGVEYTVFIALCRRYKRFFIV